MSDPQGPIPDEVREIKETLEAAGHHVVIPPHASFKNPTARCRACGVRDDLRFDFCFACADAQSIIGTGQDGYDQGEGGVKLSGKEAMQRVHLLIRNGWRFVPSCEQARREFLPPPTNAQGIGQ